MSKKKNRLGGKYCSSHSTIIPEAIKIIDAIYNQSEITKIQLGFIKGGLKSINGQKRVKIGIKGFIINLSIRGNTTHQEFFIHSMDNQKTMEEVAKKARNLNFHISFGERT